MDQVIFDEPGLRISTDEKTITIRVDWRRHAGSAASLINQVVDYLQETAVGSSLAGGAREQSAWRPARPVVTLPADSAAGSVLTRRRLRQKQIYHGPSL